MTTTPQTMVKGFCDSGNVLDFSSSCIRSAWITLLPSCLVVFFFLLTAIEKFPNGRVAQAYRVLKAPFVLFLPLPDAENLLSSEAQTALSEEEVVPHVSHLVRKVLFVALSLLEALGWLAVALTGVITKSSSGWDAAQPFLVAFIFSYAVSRPITSSLDIVPLDLFVVYVFRLIGVFNTVGGMLFDHIAEDVPLPSTLYLIAMAIDFAVLIVLISTLLFMPFAVPSFRVKKADIGHSVTPEDYATLFQWITFSWVYPLIQRGRNTTLEDHDVWALGPSFRSRPLFIRFNAIKGSSLVRRMWKANSRDFIVDFLLTITSVGFEYSPPLFLRLILSQFEDSELDGLAAEDKFKAYVYAFMMFFCALARAESDVQRLWVERRAATRIRTELMAAIYDKTLKRKDLSGLTGTADVKKTADNSTKESSKDNEERKPAKTEGADTGKIVNLMAGDVQKISDVTVGLYMFYAGPMEISIAGYFLYKLLGWAALTGVLVIVLAGPLNNKLASRGVTINKALSTARDKRMSVVNELIGAIKFIKFFAWEDRWIQRALDRRDVEIAWMTKARVNSVLFFMVWTAAPILVSVSSFWVYVMFGGVLTVSKAFTSIALFQLIRSPLSFIPMFIVQVLQAGVALDRISSYLDEGEVSEQVSCLKQDAVAREVALPEGLGLRDATLKWNETEDPKDNNSTDAESPVSSASSTPTLTGDEFPLTPRFKLRNISVMFPERKLSVITGPTASGKTAMLMALLGELTLEKGELIMRKDLTKVDEYGLTHSISYGAQNPWLRHQSIKDNILFGQPYDETRYKAVLEACALLPDLNVLEDGDQTEIGSRGVSLSGGQKARVALARAVYASTQYVLLDDPLSAIDSHTARFLYDNLFLGPLMANRTVILVTHHVELVLPGTYYLVRLVDGCIEMQGKVQDLHSRGLLEVLVQTEKEEVQKEEAVAAANEPEVAKLDEIPSPLNEPTHAPRKLVQDEARETGSVKWPVYKSYLKASSYIIWAFLVLCVILSQCAAVMEKIWIMIWGEAADAAIEGTIMFVTSSAQMSSTAVPDHYGLFYHISETFSNLRVMPRQWPNVVEHPMFYVGVYASIGLINVIISLCTVTAQYTGALRASRILFKQLLVSVVRATFRFHDTTPQGRMLNRFGKDIETIDMQLAGSMQSVNSSLATFFTSVLTIAFIFPIFLLPASIIAMLYRHMAVGYLNTGRDLRRMESNTRSPIFSDFSELLDGIVTVRAYSAERRFLDNLHEKIDATTKMHYAYWMCNRWLLLNFDALGGVAVLITALFSISRITDGAGIAGVCITSAMNFTMSIYWACRFWTELELNLNSVERVIEYFRLPQEPPAITESNRPPAYWPSSASDTLITAENLTVKYAPELPDVIHNVSFNLKAKERIGLLGRTGSGKSTLAMSFLRFVDPAGGRIFIDGIDIATIGIHDLRTRITFIPQDATLFSGTLRDNLDPFGDHADSECMDVLQRVNMITESQLASQRASLAGSSRGSSNEDTISVASSDTNGESAKTVVTLDTVVSAGGTNFSQGQRQLISMARALLRRSAVIILDEATSSIDFATDRQIQATIREEFNDSLLVTVAHRLNTVIDYDRLMVLDQGSIAEFDTPYNLLQKETGIFKEMCLKSGIYSQLEAIAKAKAEETK